MVIRGQTWRIHLAGLTALGGYSWLASQAGALEARPALAMAMSLGWIAMAVICWRTADSRQARWSVVGWAICFRVVGLGTTPTWEDDYNRYLWDGYQLLTTGDPYARAPADFFGQEDQLPDVISGRLDQVNHPERKTIYGPVAQLIFGVSAGLGLGSLAVFKLVLVGVEMSGWWLLRKALAWRGWVLVWWCPLTVVEIAFAGHPDAIGVAALALALAGWQASKTGGGASAGTVLAAATKPFGWVLAPFVVDRFGWRYGAVMAGMASACYAPFWLQGSTAEWGAILGMGQDFEYNSTGYALLAGLLPAAGARVMAGGLTLGFAVGAWWLWRQGQRENWPPVAGILAVAFWWSPVVNPWYALWLLPSLALRPTAWGVGLLLAVPLAYTHGWGASGGAVVNYVHPGWTRPLEVAVVVGVTVGWWGWQNRRTHRVG